MAFRRCGGGDVGRAGNAFSNLKEDANFAAFYLMALALGVLMISKSGNQVDLIHILFGSVLWWTRRRCC